MNWKLKGYEFLSFAKNMVKNTVKNISKSLNTKYNQKLLDDAKQSATDTFKTSSRRVIQKTVEATSHLIENNIADKITIVSETSPQSNLETNEKTLREKYISPKRIQKIIDDVRLK